MRFHLEHASVVITSLNCGEGSVCLCVGDLPLEQLEEAVSCQCSQGRQGSSALLRFHPAPREHVMNCCFKLAQGGDSLTKAVLLLTLIPLALRFKTSGDRDFTAYPPGQLASWTASTASSSSKV